MLLDEFSAFLTDKNIYTCMCIYIYTRVYIYVYIRVYIYIHVYRVV